MFPLREMRDDIKRKGFLRIQSIKKKRSHISIKMSYQINIWMGKARFIWIKVEVCRFFVEESAHVRISHDIYTFFNNAIDFS